MSVSVCVSGGRRDKTEGANCGVGGGGDCGAIVIGPYIRDCPGSHQTRGKEGREREREQAGRCSDGNVRSEGGEHTEQGHE